MERSIIKLLALQLLFAVSSLIAHLREQIPSLLQDQGEAGVEQVFGPIVERGIRSCSTEKMKGRLDVTIFYSR